MKPLAGKVAIVAGATRGAGRGVACMLGEAGATVYCTGRSSRTQPNTSQHHYAHRPETIEETAGLIDAAGGTGIAARVDHTVDSEVEALFRRVEREQKRLDILVNILTGQPVASWSSFWKLPVEEGRGFLDGWIWPHIVTAWHAAALMTTRRSGLLVEIIEQDSIDYHGQFFFDLMEIVLKRVSFGLALELAPTGVTALSITPGFMRTEAILEGFGVSETNWRDALEKPEAKAYGWGGSETPCFVGRGVAALAADPQVSKKSGGLFTSRALSEEYCFTDVDGTLPDYAVLEEAVGKFFGKANLRPPYKWQVTKVSGP